MTDLLSTEDVNVLAHLTNRDHAGRHFTELHPDDLIERFEELGLVEISRPVHEATGLPYDQQYWTLEVTDYGRNVVDGRYDPRDDPDAND